MPPNFYELIGPGGKDEGRHVFERLVTQLVRLKYPGMGLAPNPGDWGIDSFVGELDGMISIWQSKFFIDGFGKDQQAQVRESFNSAVAAAKKHNHVIGAWTLCVPVEMEPETAKWWPGWRRRAKAKTGIEIDLWTAAVLEQQLLTVEATDVARHYFPASMGSIQGPRNVAVLPLPPDGRYDEALFVKQLQEAGISEAGSAKRQFFNYEILSREVADKADPFEMQTLEADQAEIHALWETRSVNSIPDKETGRCPGLHGDVMRAIEGHHQQNNITKPTMSVVHRFGGMHQIVENGDAGWVGHFRGVAEAHRG